MVRNQLISYLVDTVRRSTATIGDTTGKWSITDVKTPPPTDAAAKRKKHKKHKQRQNNNDQKLGPALFFFFFGPALQGGRADLGNGTERHRALGGAYGQHEAAKLMLAEGGDQ